MHEEAFQVLSAINRGDSALRSSDAERWVHAFAVIKWAQVTDETVALTAEGLAALNAMRSAHSGGGSTAAW